MTVERIVVGMLETNCYVLFDEKTKKGIVIDPGGDFPKIKKKIEELGIVIDKVILTHAHIDHMAALDELKIYTKAEILIHSLDEKMLSQPDGNLSFLVGQGFQFPPVDGNLKENDRVTCGELELRVIHTPGHTPGGICLLGRRMLFTGDTLFHDSIGRTDLPGSSLEDMKASLGKLTSIRENVTIYPGHGPVTTLKREKENNPFLLELR